MNPSLAIAGKRKIIVMESLELEGAERQALILRRLKMFCLKRAFILFLINPVMEKMALIYLNP